MERSRKWIMVSAEEQGCCNTQRQPEQTLSRARSNFILFFLIRFYLFPSSIYWDSVRVCSAVSSLFFTWAWQVFLAHIYIITVKIILMLVKTMTHIRHKSKRTLFGPVFWDKWQVPCFSFHGTWKESIWLAGIWIGMGGSVCEVTHGWSAALATPWKIKKIKQKFSQMTVICLMSIGQAPLRWSKKSQGRT